MATRPSARSTRESRARAALSELGSGLRTHLVLHVDCASSHHLARVYATSIGPVYASVTRARSHGDRDFVDVGHHADRDPHPFVDLLDVSATEADDVLPAWCDCGARTFSRAAVAGWLRDGERRVVVD